MSAASVLSWGSTDKSSDARENPSAVLVQMKGFGCGEPALHEVDPLYASLGRASSNPRVLS